MHTHPTLTGQSCSEKKKTVNSLQCQSVTSRPNLRPARSRTTGHTRERMAERAVSREAIEATLLYGTYLYRSGALFVILLRKDIEKIRMPELLRFEGTTVVFRKDGVITTVYINSDAYRRIKKLPKHGFKKHGFKWDPPPGAPACALQAA